VRKSKIGILQSALSKNYFNKKDVNKLKELEKDDLIEKPLPDSSTNKDNENIIWTRRPASHS
jgi:hypothetical protein